MYERGRDGEGQGRLGGGRFTPTPTGRLSRQREVLRVLNSWKYTGADGTSDRKKFNCGRRDARVRIHLFEVGDAGRDQQRFKRLGGRRRAAAAG